MVITRFRNYLHRQYEVRLLPRVNQHWHHVEPYFEISKSVLFHGTVAFVIASFCLYISAFLFGALYFYNMPTICHTYDLNFQYNRGCVEQHRNYLRNGIGHVDIYGSRCYPTAVVDFDSTGRKKALRPDQAYRVDVSLELPESDSNLGIGIFMVTMRYGMMTSSKPTSIKFRPTVIRLVSIVAFWPLLLFDIMEAKQTLNIPLFEEARFGHPSPEEIEICKRRPEKISRGGEKGTDCNLRIATIEIDYPDIQIYSARLQVAATFSGLQYFLFQWPVFSFLVGTAIFFVPVLASVLVLFYLILFKPYRAIRQSLSIDDDRGQQRRRDRRRRTGNRDSSPTEGTTEATPVQEELCEGDEECNTVGDSNSSSTISSTFSSIEMLGSPSLENITVGAEMGAHGTDITFQNDNGEGTSSETAIDTRESSILKKLN